MAQKELKKKADALEKVPSKTGILDSIDVELTLAGYKNVGSVAGTSFSATMGPLTLGVGGGAEKLAYYNNAIPYARPEIELQGIVRGFEIYGAAKVPIMPKTKETNFSFSPYLNSGVVWEPISPKGKNRMSFRLGSEIKIVSDICPAGIQQGSVQLGSGISGRYGPVTVYAIENTLFYPETQYNQSFGNMLRPHHHKTRAGVVVDYEGISIKGEFSQETFKIGGELSISFKTEHWVPEIRGWYSKEDELVGGADKAGIGLNLEFGWGRFKSRAKLEGGASMGPGREGGISEWEPHSSFEQYGEFWVEAIDTSQTLSEFAGKYAGKSKGEVLYAARQLGYYGYKRYKDTSLKEAEGVGTEEAFKAIKNGGSAAMCANITSLQATFLREAGWEANGIAIASDLGAHAVSTAKAPDGSSYLIGGGMGETGVLEDSEGGFLPLIREYARLNGIAPHSIYIYGKGNKLIGHYELEEGKLNRAMAGDKETLKDALLHLRPKKRK